MGLRAYFLLYVLTILTLSPFISTANNVSNRDTIYDQVNQLLLNDSTFQKNWEELLSKLHENSISGIVSHSGGLAPYQLDSIAEWNRELYQIYDELVTGFEDKFQERKPLILISDSTNISIQVGKLSSQNINYGIAKKLKLSNEGLYVIIISSRALNEYGTVRDQIAGILAHELSHIKNGDIDKKNEDVYISRIHSKGNEMAADLGAVELCKGKFSLRSLINNFSILESSRTNPKKNSHVLNSLRNTHPADEVRQNSTALSVIDSLMVYPQYDIPETISKLPKLATYSRIDPASREEIIKLTQALTQKKEITNDSEKKDLIEIIRKLNLKSRSEIINEVLTQMLSSNDSTSLFKLPQRLYKLDLLNSLTESVFTRWFEVISKQINTFNIEDFSVNEKENLIKLCLQTENANYLIRYRQADSVKQLFEKILVPIYKNTSMGAIAFNSPLSLEFIRYLKTSNSAVTDLEVGNLELLTRRHYMYLQSLPGSQNAYTYYEFARNILHTAESKDLFTLGKNEVVNHLLNTFEFEELVGMHGKFPEVLRWSAYKNKNQLSKYFQALSLNFEWQLEFIKKLTDRLPPYFIFRNDFTGDYNTNDMIKKIFYQLISSDKTSTKEKITLFKLLIDSNIQYDTKTLNVLSSIYKKLPKFEQHNLFYTDKLMSLNEIDFNNFRSKNDKGGDNDALLVHGGAYYIHLIELFHKTNMKLPLSGRELNQLIKFFEVTGRYFSLNTDSYVVKYLVSELLQHKDELPIEEFGKSFHILLNRVAYLMTRASLSHIFPQQLSEFSDTFKASLQKTNQWNLKTVAKLHEFNAMFQNLSSDAINDLMEKELTEALKGDSKQQRISQVQNLFSEFRKTYFLNLTHRVIYYNTFEKAILQLQLTPQEYKEFKLNALDSEGYHFNRLGNLEKSLINFGDGILDWTLNQEPKKQIEILDYILDSNKNLPDWIVKNNQKVSRDGEAADYVSESVEKIENLKSLFQRSDSPTQSAIISYFLTDSRRGFLSSPDHELQLLKRLTKDLHTSQTELAMAFYRAIKKTDPNFYTHMLSRAVALKNRTKGSASDSSSLLVPLVEYFDVPGIKLAQMSHFGFDGSEKLEGFEKFYESAIVLSNSQILDHLDELYGERFPQHWKFVKPLGFGSANYAVLFYDEKNKSEFVLNIPRKNIAEISKQKFNYFQTFLSHLNNELKNKEEIIDLLEGLSKFLKRSMDLEFDRERVFKRTQKAATIYSGNIKGWRFSPIQAGAVDTNGVISMSLAKGESLASLEKTDPKLFQKSSAAIAEFLGNRLLSKDSNKLLNTNGDWHPGQFFVDRTNSQVSILDFGQESAMSHKELLFAKDLLVIISQDEFAKHTNFDLQKSFDLLKQSLKDQLHTDLPSEKLEGFKFALSKSTSMARFVYLISYLENQGIKIPVTAGHWIKEVNAVLNFEREGHTGARFSEKLKKDLFNHLKQRYPEMKIKLNSPWADKVYQIESAFNQTLNKMKALFKSKLPQDTPNTCLKYYK